MIWIPILAVLGAVLLIDQLALSLSREHHSEYLQCGPEPIDRVLFRLHSELALASHRSHQEEIRQAIRLVESRKAGGAQ